MIPRSTLRSTLLCCSLAGLSACGPALDDRDRLATVMAVSAVPAAHARQGQVPSRSFGELPQPSLTLAGARGGFATIDFNLVGGAVGLVGEGVLFQVRYSDYSHDGLIRLSGDVSVLANFAFVGSAQGLESADVSLSVAGTARLSGLYTDTLNARIRLSTRLSGLQLQGAPLPVRLDGFVQGDAARFEFKQEDLLVHWDAFAPRTGG